MEKEHVLGMINVIDVCAKRGAFEGSELGRIATLRAVLVAEAGKGHEAKPPVEGGIADGQEGCP